MPTAPAPTGPTPAALPTGGVALPPTPAQKQTALESGIWYHLSLWQALHLACTNSWGGPDSWDKRDWFAGAVADLVTTRPDTDEDDLIVFLLQVMTDEFGVDVEDDSEEEVARGILALRKRVVVEGDLAALREVELRWRNRGSLKMDIRAAAEEEEGSSGEEFDEDDEDVEMMDVVPEGSASAATAAPRREKVEVEVDEDGFTKVVGKGKKK